LKKYRLSGLLFLFLALFSSYFAPLQAASNNLKIHFLDVGQADSILIQSPSNKVMLIDAGNREDSGTIEAYLRKEKISKLDLLIATHPHEDHIGGMADIVKHFNIGQIYMPKVSHTTATFKNLLIAIKSKNLKVNTAISGVKLDFDTKVTCQMLAPNSANYDNLNDYSPVIKMVYNKNSFLFTGDAAKESEKEMLQKGVALNADLLKVGHHGSNTSTTDAFLRAVSPKYAVISVGVGNDYGHPGRYTMGRLQKAGVTTYRTDQQGIIIASSDGQKISFSFQRQAATQSSSVNQAQTENKTNIVYVTRTGAKYHRAGCKSLARSCIPIKLNEALAQGYEACKACKP
jgi:competence protein ComEC